MTLQSNYGELHALTPEANVNRERFLKDARKLLRELGAVLSTRHGARVMRVARLAAHMGNAGGVVAEYNLPGHASYLECTIGTASTSQRQDRVVLIVRWTGTANAAQQLGVYGNAEAIADELNGFVTQEGADLSSPLPASDLHQ